MNVPFAGSTLRTAEEICQSPSRKSPVSILASVHWTTAPFAVGPSIFTHCPTLSAAISSAGVPARPVCAHAADAPHTSSTPQPINRRSLLEPMVSLRLEVWDIVASLPFHILHECAARG